MTEKIISWFVITGLLNTIYELNHIEFTRDTLYLSTLIWGGSIIE